MGGAERATRETGMTRGLEMLSRNCGQQRPTTKEHVSRATAPSTVQRRG